MPTYISPTGNPEVWNDKPDGYLTPEAWKEAHPSPPPPEPTVEEKIAQLDAEYNAEKDDLLKAYQSAMMYGDDELMESLKSDLSALDDQYDEDYEAIMQEEEEDGDD